VGIAKRLLCSATFFGRKASHPMPEANIIMTLDFENGCVGDFFHAFFFIYNNNNFVFCGPSSL
jgi:hypothetical protein